MGKAKTPLLSLSASGSIADSLTYQRRLQTDIVRKKSEPAYRRTLAQMYQRWLYSDYIYQWNQLTYAEKRTYAAQGTRFHLTPFQFHMKHMLGTQPDIMGIWHLDEQDGAIAHDSSLNLNHGTIFGALHLPAIISNGLWFDGLNDDVIIPYSPTLDIGIDDFTIVALINTKNTITNVRYAVKFNLTPRGWFLGAYAAGPVLQARLHDAANSFHLTGATGVADDLWHTIIATFDRDSQLDCKVFLDGIDDTALRTGLITNMINADAPTSLYLGSHFQPAWRWHKGYLDEIRLYRQVWTDDMALRFHQTAMAFRHHY